MDFFHIASKDRKEGGYELYPDFIVGRSQDLMVRGRSFYAVWDEEAGLWSRDEYDVQRLVDEKLREKHNGDETATVKYLRSFNSYHWQKFKQFLGSLSDNHRELDSKLTFSNTDVKKTDYVSRRLPYPLEPGDYGAWDELVGTLYSVEEREKIEWAIGAVVSGDSKRIQKFLVLYGPGGTGKSTILNVVQKLFEGYTTTFEAKALGSNNGSFATEVFKENPLVAIQHDGDLSKIEDNTRLNSIISHEEMTMNEKYKPSYTARVNAFLFMGTNKPVKISDAKSGIIRRLIDVHPTGVRIPVQHYQALMDQIDFQLGAIAHHCLEVYRGLGKNYYNSYRPLEMMLNTDVFFNYIEAHFDIFKEQDGVTLRQAYSLYKEYCSDTGIEKAMPQYKFREELRNYFDIFTTRKKLDNGTIVRSYYEGFNANKFKAPVKEANVFSLVMDEVDSIFDEEFAGYRAQLATDAGIPKMKWENVRTSLADIDTNELHYVKVPENHIVIDFDLKDDNGTKSAERNLEAASGWPATYAEFSQGGGGVHLHYLYDGDTSLLRSDYSDGIEVKVFRGNSSLRRRLTKCNNVPIATLNSGLPLKEKRMLTEKTIQSEKGLRDMIARNLKKEFHPSTVSSCDFIKKILDEAYESGMKYDVSDLESKVFAFAANASNSSLRAIKVVQQIKWKSEEEVPSYTPNDDDPVVLFDCEVYPNLFVVCWKYEDSDNVVRMINPSPADVEELFRFKLVGFYNRRFDNHILYARSMGYDNDALFKLTQKIINDKKQSAMFGEAYNLSYADIWDFSSKKQSLKRFMIELGITKVEMEIPWDQPVPEDMIPKVVEYCVNDVLGTEAVWKARKQDFVARQILAELSGLTVNHTTQRHTAKIIFGDDRRPQEQFVYTDLSKEFPGYEFDMGKSSYRGENPSEGGYVYAEPGVYSDVAVLDIASMHPTSIEVLNLFGPYTQNFSELKAARLAIKRSDYASAKKMLGGKLAPYLKEESDAKDLSYALKIVINIVYGLTSAKFDNPFRDNRNIDNIVAKRGALFMIDLKHYIQDELNINVVHIKTDSVKIPDVKQGEIDKIVEFGKKYGYDFEHEVTYDKFCLVNEAVYIASVGDKWEAVGAQFQHPYVYKTLFTGEEITWSDLCETKQVQQGVMYLDFEHDRPAVLSHDGMQHIGKIGSFVPVTQSSGGGALYRVKDGKQYAVTGTKGYLWMESEKAKMLGEKVEIDWNYYQALADDARKAIDKHGGFDKFMAPFK